MTEVDRVLLGDVAFEYLQRLGDGAGTRPVYGVDKSVGLTTEPRYQASNLSRYKRIERGMFAYNPMRLNIGSIGFCSGDLAPGIVSPDYVVFGCHEQRLLPKFLDYHTHALPWAAWLSLAGEGSVRERIYFRKLAQYEFLLPAIRYQVAAVEVLSALDEKIELNRRVSETLEDLAQAIFRDWFVEFGPLRRKQAGATDPAAILGGLALDPTLAGDVAALYPDSFGRDGLPQGWNSVTLGDAVSVFETGSRPKGGIKGIEFGVPSIGAENVIGLAKYNFEKTKFVPREYFERMRRGVLGSRDILLYKDGGRPGEFEPHVAMFGAGFPFEECCINEHVYRLVAQAPFTQEYLYLHLTSVNSTQEMRNKGTGVAIPGLNSAAARSLRILKPTSELLRSFSATVTPLFDRVFSAALESRTLVETRDYLLPKLMAGGVRVRDAEKAVP